MNTKNWKINLITLFGNVFPGILASSVVGRALDKKIWSLSLVNIRDFASNNYRQVDDKPFGGGTGLILMPEMLDKAIEKSNEKQKLTLVYPSPRGIPFTQKVAKSLIKTKGLNIICGKYEGIDERIIEKWHPLEISIGDYIVSGGELAAMVIIDTCVRLLNGVISETANNEESFVNGLLEYPQYTKPSLWQGMQTPEILLSGNHEKIKKWKILQSEKITKKYRPDLWSKYVKKKL